MPSPDVGEFAAIAADLHAEPDADVTARNIVEHGVDIVAQAEHVSLTIALAGGGHTTLAATSELAEKVDMLQYELDEGPCIQVADGASWFCSGDVTSDPRWPRWGPAAGEHGVRSVLAVRLDTVDKSSNGALNFFSTQSGAFSESEIVDVAQVYAVHAANALSAACTAAGLQTALTSRHTIGLAQGILMERYRLDQQRSFDLLRRTSSVHNIKLRDLASTLVETGQLPGQPPSPG
ncbi:GAF and ANTAR domain-containing protein [Nocardioides piscis]|uniref:GAF and ANTAR domain-containing protein n=1 Tax=Nocardioides piscis TaxID=2714938 RepID=A0A6G7YCH0_9ACTN|nr:GAF and ANTAR domain-containing protein [Nocardioides piscis]QIK74604.1 GAF and ANTAR domain-containing protein [Nocardioides piscis]